MKQNIRGEDKLVQLESVVPNDWNPKEALEDNGENRKRYEEIKSEIKNRGLYQAITVRQYSGKYQIIDGYHRWRACKELGYMDIRVNDLGEVSDSDAMLMTVNLERLKVPISDILLASTIKSLSTDIQLEDLSDELQIPIQDIQEYIGLSEFDWNEFDKKHVEPEAKTMVCPHCGEVIEL